MQPQDRKPAAIFYLSARFFALAGVDFLNDIVR